jgi:two-component system sensor histidine kinase UhpB
MTESGMSDESSDQWQTLAILSTTPTGIITSFDRASECLLGFEAVEVVGTHLLAAFHDALEVRQRAAAHASELGAGEIDEFRVIVANTVPGRTTKRDWTYVHRTGRQVPIHLSVSAVADAAGQISGYVMVLQEIRRDVRSDKVLQQQAQLLDLANDAILIRDLERDTISYWNNGAARLYGWTSGEAHGAYIHEFLKTVFPQPLAEIRKTFLATGHWTGELLHTTRDGSKITVSSRWTLLKNSTGVPSGSLELNTDITQQKLVQEALKAAHEELELRVKERTTDLSDANKRLQILSQRLMEVQELERRAIARDLHDEIGQALTAIKLNLREFGETVTAEGMEKQVSDSLLILDQVLRHIRNLSLDLRPSMLDELGLVPALRWYVGRQAERAGWAIAFIADEIMPRPSPEVEISCFRLTQEALTNVARHANATAVEVRLEIGRGQLNLFIRDNGIGFDPALIGTGDRAGTSVGLSGMGERVRLAGGYITIHSAPADGTEIHAAFPLDPKSVETKHE